MATAISGYNKQTQFNSSRIGFSNQVLNKLPWGVQLLDNMTQLNDRFENFNALTKTRENRLGRMSVFNMPFADMQREFGMGGILGDKTFQTFMYANLDLDKIRRVNEYRQMAYYSTVSDCLDEISDELLFEDGSNYVKLKLDTISDAMVKDSIKEEWERFCSMFEFQDKGWNRFRRFLIEGELYFENIISKERPNLGILGLVEIPTELINPVYGNIQNDIIEHFVLRRPVIDPITQNVDHEDVIAMDKNQITYVNSGLKNADGSITLPYLEKARRAYKQLSMMEDCIMIQRMARSPEKLVFNVDTGNMSPPVAENYLRRLMQQFFSRKTYDNSTGRPSNVYDPQTLTDSFWFPKRANSEGSSVSSIGSSANFSQMDDLLYFQKNLYRAMNVPLGRLNPEDGFKDGNDSTREEIRFGKYITRIQKRFAQGMKESFITHLKLREMWIQYNLRESDLDIEFNVSSVFAETRKQQFLDMKFNNFTTITGNEGVSNTWAQKKWLGFTDEEVASNREWKRQDAILAWELQQISQAGPNWKKNMQNQQELASQIMGGGGGGMGGGESGMPPEMGPTPGGGESPPMEAPPMEGGGEPPSAEAAAPESTPPA
jgi:hypothetical protein